MNTTHGNAVLPASFRRDMARARMQWTGILAPLIVLGLMFGTVRAAGINPDQPIRVDGMEFFFGFVPAEILRGHPREHKEQTMHSGVPSGRGARHLTISLFDAKTRARITDAAVTVSVTEFGRATQNQKLEAMVWGGTVTYGNYFAMPNQGPYEIVVNVRRSGDNKTAAARFQYWQSPR